MTEKDVMIDGLRAIANKVLPSNGHVYLYGSRARGDAHENSDWDLLLVFDKDKIDQSDYDQVSYPFTLFGWEKGESVIPVLFTKKEWDENYYSSFNQNVEHDRILIA